ncbi:MAG: N-formylglutamate amidohydrolase [Deltaproteobacteria bacterium]|nr:N-formylglutamate amidohydrolase [Deltaproteobacteria bacterium]
MDNKGILWSIQQGSGPLLATAIHHGHSLRAEVANRLYISELERLREEDPHTGELTTIVDCQLIVHRSRFEMDINRDRSNAVYRVPADAWGLRVWQSPPDIALIRRSLAQYDAFYQMLHGTLNTMLRTHPIVVVLDFHSYNHRRSGPDRPADNPLRDPEIEIGTDTMDRQRWAPVVDNFKQALQRYTFNGRKLDVRENVKFGSGWMSRWIHSHFPYSVCAISVELKKLFMDEWTGKLYPQMLNDYRQAFASTIPGLIQICQTFPSDV